MNKLFSSDAEGDLLPLLKAAKLMQRDQKSFKIKSKAIRNPPDESRLHSNK